MIKKNKLLFVVYGLAFRQDKNTLFGREYNISDFEIEAQKICCYNHNNLINFIKKKYDLEIDVQLITYTYNDFCDNMLQSLYKPKFTTYLDSFLNSHKYYKHNISEKSNQVRWPQHDMHSKILFENDEYDYIFAVRIDLCFKNNFLNYFKLSNDKIILTSPNDTSAWIKEKKETHIGRKLVVDHYFLIPKVFFNIKQHYIDKNSTFCVNHFFLINTERLKFNFNYDFFDYIDWRGTYYIHWNPMWYVPTCAYGKMIEGYNGEHYNKTKRDPNNLNLREPIILTTKECEDIDKDIILPIKKYTQSELNELWGIAINNNWLVNRKIKDVFIEVLEPKHIKAVGKKISHTHIDGEVIEDISSRSLLYKDNNGVIRICN